MNLQFTILLHESQTSMLAVKAIYSNLILSFQDAFIAKVKDYVQRYAKR